MMASPEGFKSLRLSCNDLEGTGERRTLAHIDGKERCYARDGQARAARCATPQPEQRGGSLNAEE